MQAQQERASKWFRALRERIIARLEGIEAEAALALKEASPAHFSRKSWTRPEGGGGEMGLMRGHIFEKAGVNVSTVHGPIPEALAKDMKHAAGMTHFWASGISVVIHPRSPRVPAVHMNTRMLMLDNSPFGVDTPEELASRSGLRDDPAGAHSNLTGARGGIGGSVPPVNTGTASPLEGNSTPGFTQGSERGARAGTASPLKIWYGGGADLTPVRPNEEDTKTFHAALKACCDRFSPEYYPKFSKACDEYFFLKHRGEPRGVGGIFYDYLNSGDEEADFAFTQGVGEAFLDIYPKIAERRMGEVWEPHERDLQLIRRGRYVEFNLLYDRGTRFGLLTGGNPEAILMSLPPEVKWP